MYAENLISQEELDTISYKIIGLAIEVHKQLGPGLLELLIRSVCIMKL